MVVFSGAGLSAKSGIPTFRDSNGLWENHRVEDVASPGGWRRDPALVLRFYDLRFRGIQAAQPNEAHRSIARLQAKFNVLNITQNIDDLLERAAARMSCICTGSSPGGSANFTRTFSVTASTPATQDPSGRAGEAR